MNSRLSGKFCLVTGASRGIGAAIAAELARQGARVAVHYGRNRDLAEQVAASLYGDKHLVLGADLADPASAAGLIQQVVTQAGQLDVLVNNAGIYVPHPPLAVDAAEWLDKWQATLAVNLVSPAVLCHAAAKVMAEQGGGRIINIGSRGAFRGEPESPAYGASKAGLHAMSQSLALALGPQGIRRVENSRNPFLLGEGREGDLGCPNLLETECWLCCLRSNFLEMTTNQIRRQDSMQVLVIYH